MQRRLAVVLFCALMIAGAASYAVYRLANAHTPVPRQVSSVKVVVAARDLDVGTLVHEGDLRVADWTGALPKGVAITKAGAVNRGVTSTIYEGEPVTENRLAPVGSGGGLAATIRPGMRACAVRVNEVVGVAGFVLPGMRVDVLMTGNPPGDGNMAGPAVKTLLQNIEVLSAGSNIEKDKEGKPQQVQVVNLLVNPRQAEILSLAGNETRIQLVLRNPTDTEITKPPGTTMADLFEVPKTPVTAAARAPTPQPEALRLVPPEPVFQTIEVTNGANHTQAKFHSGEPNP